MIRSTACRQLSYAAAILAVALLCAQTLIVVHDHQLTDSEYCAVCSTPAEHADSADPVCSAGIPHGLQGAPALHPAAAATEPPSSRHARGPPLA